MKKVFYIFILVSYLVSFNTLTFARPWDVFVEVDVSNRQHGYGYVEEEKRLFKANLEIWKRDIDKDIDYYVKKGIKKDTAKKAIEERNKLAQNLIDSNFNEPKDISPRLDFLDNRIHVMNHIAALGHERFKKLIKKENIKMNDNFYNCLCRSYSIMGVGIQYSPARDKHCDTTAPCKGGNWGCVSHNLPKDTGVWMSCARSYPTKDGGNLFQALNSSFKLNERLTERELKDKIQGRLKKFRDLCLPVIPDVLEKSILNTSDLTRRSIARESMDISDKAANVCEEAISVFLFLSGQEGRTSAEIGVDLIIGYKMPNQFDVASKFAGLLSLAEAAPILNVFSKALTIKSSIELLDKEYAKNKSNLQFRDAYQLFQESKNWTVKNQNLYEKVIANEISNIDKEMNQKRSMLKSNIDSIYPKIKEIQVYGREYIPNTKVPNNEQIWKKYRRKRNSLIRVFESEIGPLLYKRAGLIINKNVIKNYRKPLTQKGCDKFLGDRESTCKK